MEGEPNSMYPILAILIGCCACATCDHTAALPTPAMNSRRLIRRSHRRGQERGRELEVERLGSGLIDDEIEFRRLFNGEVGRLRPAQNLIDIVSAAPEEVREVWSI